MENISDWTYKNKPFTDPTGWYGFVYEITNIKTGQSYIGRKYFSKATSKKVKGKVKRSRTNSDWVDYWGSSKVLQAQVEKYGKDSFRREIIRLCKTRGECNYMETRIQIDLRVLETKLANGEYQYLNENVAMKYTRRNIGFTGDR